MDDRVTRQDELLRLEKIKTQQLQDLLRYYLKKNHQQRILQNIMDKNTSLLFYQSTASEKREKEAGKDTKNEPTTKNSFPFKILNI